MLFLLANGTEERVLKASQKVTELLAGFLGGVRENVENVRSKNQQVELIEK
jgi:hypothetical protein